MGTDEVAAEQPDVGWQQRTDNLTWRELDGEIVILDLEGGVYHQLNDSGAVLWKALAELVTVGELAQALVGLAGISQEQAQHDVEDFLGQCLDLGIVQRLQRQ